MAKFSIISRDGKTIRYTGCPKYTGTYLNVPYLEFATIESPTPINWQRGDFVVYHRTGLTYRLYTLPEPKKQARKDAYGAAFVYSNVKFYSAVKDFEIAPFRDLVSEDNKIHFSTRPEVNTFENVYGIAARIQECMDDIFANKWVVRVFDTEDADLAALFSEARDFSVSNGSCLDALSQIYDVWKNVGWTHTVENGKDVITIGRTSLRDSSNTTDAFSYGVGNGLTSIKKAAANEAEFATRLYVYGSDRNIQTRYYNEQNILDKESVDIRNLMIPIDKWGTTDGLPDARKAYLQADDAVVEKYGLIPRTVYFDGGENEEIYPSITGLTFSKVRKEMQKAGIANQYVPKDIDERMDLVYGDYSSDLGDGSKEDMEKNPTFMLGLRSHIGFNIIEQGALASDGYATVSMKSGMCAGREFKVKAQNVTHENAPVWTLERYWDESVGMGYPNSIYPIEEGDQFVLLDIPMPEYYITLAEERLYEAAQNLLADYTRVSAYYEPSVDSIKIIEEGKNIREGMYMQVVDSDIIDTEDHSDYVLIDTLEIDEKNNLPTYRVTLREQKRSIRTFGTLEEMIEETKRDTTEKIDRQRQYTDRRFRSALETIDMLKGAFSNFSDGVTPVSVQTMSMLVGDAGLQYIFTESRDTLDTVPCPLSYNNDQKRFAAVPASLIHMTLGIETVTTSNARTASDYLSWDMPSWSSERFEESEKRYYIYAKVPKDGTEGTYECSESPIALEAVSGYYYLLVGILNTEFDEKRDFITLYGFTEVLPGQITTDVIRSADGTCYFDLANNEIGGKIKFAAGSEGLENISGDVNIGGQNLLRNSGFTGDYLSERLADEVVLDAISQMENSPLAYWTNSVNVVVFEDAVSASGYAVKISNGVLKQTLYQPTIATEKYVFSAKIKGKGSVVVNVGGAPYTIEVDSTSYKKYKVAVGSAANSYVFEFGTTSEIMLCEPQLERGTLATAWGNSPLDNTSDRAYYQSIKYLSDAIKGTTTINGGLVMTNTMVLGNPDDEIEKSHNAGMNGITTEAGDDVAFWAGGTFDQATVAVSKYQQDPSYKPTEEELLAMAKAVITHGGRAIFNDAIISGAIYANSGRFGDFAIDGLYAISSHDDAHGCKWGDGLYRSWYGDYRSDMQAAAVRSINYNGETSIFSGFYSNASYVADPGATNNKFAFYALSGQIGGMRPTLRVISETGSGNAANIIYDADHTLIVRSFNHTFLGLPSSPKDGQELAILIPYGTKVTIRGLGIFDMAAGVESNTWTSADDNKAKKIALIYSSEIGSWFLSIDYIS